MLFHVPMLACARYYVILYCIILEIFNISAMHMRDIVFLLLLLLYNRQTPCKVLGYHADERVHSRLQQTVLESVQ